MEVVSIPLRAISHEMRELEFHMSPVLRSSRPHTAVGTPRDEVEDPSGAGRIARETARTVDGLAYVRDATVAPASNLVAEQAKPRSLAVADGKRSHGSRRCNLAEKNSKTRPLIRTLRPPAPSGSQ